jgi:uncharacterized membrane protein YccC
MAATALRTGNTPHRADAIFNTARLKQALRAAMPALLFGLRLWASVCVALYVAFWLELANPFWAGTSAAIVCQPHVGASLRKGWYRMIGTVVGAVAIVIMTACFPQDRALFLISLALWGGACAFVATILHNFAAYSAALAGYTAAIIAGDQLGATGGLNGQAFMLAVFRVSEIAIGIVCAGIILAGTDLGGARRRLAGLFAHITADITVRFIGSLTSAGPDLPDTRPVRRDFIRQVVALDPVIDETLGESSQIRYHSPVLQRAVDGLFMALAGWRAVANRLVRLPHQEAKQQASAVLQTLPLELQSLAGHPLTDKWTENPTGLYAICRAAANALTTQPVATPSLRLLADGAGEALAGLADALNGVALLVGDPAQPARYRRGSLRLRMTDWLPALVNAGRAFATIGAVALLWIITAWPSGATAITFAAIGAILFAPQADQAYATVIGFTIGTLLGAIFAAVVAFAVLPALTSQNFAILAIGMGLVLVPAGAMAAQPWQRAMFTAMAVNFVPLLGPSNPMSYDTVQFYNTASAIVVGIVVAAAAFRLLPPLSPEFRTRRLLALTSRDLRRLAMGRGPEDWPGRVHGRLAVMPEKATPLQRARLVAALSVGIEINQLRRWGRSLGIGSDIDAAFAAIAQGKSAIATARLARLDVALAGRSGSEPEMQAVLQARSRILGISEALAEHAAYFDDGALG